MKTRKTSTLNGSTEALAKALKGMFDESAEIYSAQLETVEKRLERKISDSTSVVAQNTQTQIAQLRKEVKEESKAIREQIADLRT